MGLVNDMRVKLLEEMRDDLDKKILELRGYAHHQPKHKPTEQTTPSAHAEPAQSKPIAFMSETGMSFVYAEKVGDFVSGWADFYTIPLYSHPPQPSHTTIQNSVENLVDGSDGHADESFSAYGAEGVLIYSTGSDNHLFRAYDQECGGFLDYEIQHSDLLVKIIDSDGFFYHKGDKHILDHSPATMGRTPETARHSKPAMVFNGGVSTGDIASIKRGILEIEQELADRRKILSSMQENYWRDLHIKENDKTGPSAQTSPKNTEEKA